MILITGTSGFIGKHLLHALVQEYGPSNILALTSRPVSECRYLLHNDYKFEKDYFDSAGYSDITTIIHAGAFTPKNHTQVNDWERCNKNILNTDTLLKAWFKDLKNIVYLSTLDVYAQSDVISEESVTVPASLYGYSKLYCEKMILGWSESNNKKVQILRVGHVYGPGEEAYEKIIPSTMNKLLKGQPLKLFGEGKEIRAFIFIADLVKAIMQSLQLQKDEGLINLVSEQSVSIKELISLIIDISGCHPSVETDNSFKKGRDFIFNNAKIKRLLLPQETPLKHGLLTEWEYMKKAYL